MTNILRHKGYAARVEFDAEDGLFAGHIADIDDIVGFHGDSVAELTAAFREAVDDYLETCARAGKNPDKPYTGKLMLRVDPSVHKVATLAARLSKQSLNAWSERVLKEAAERAVA